MSKKKTNCKYYNNDRWLESDTKQNINEALLYVDLVYKYQWGFI
jgi:hypothetical protein